MAKSKRKIRNGNKKPKKVAKKLPEGTVYYGDLNADTVFVVDTVVGHEDEEEAPKTKHPLSKANLSFFAKFLKEAKMKKSVNRSHGKAPCDTSSGTRTSHNKG